MLVLSRRPSQSFVFPTLGVSVQILRVAGQIVRVGVEAPRSIPVLREELEPPGDTSGPPLAVEAADEEAARQARHHLRGRLNTATIALYLAQRQLQSSSTMAAGGTLQQALDELGQLEGELAAANSPTRKPARPRIRTLLVEDNPHESALLEGYLRLSGMEVANARRGLARHAVAPLRRADHGRGHPGESDFLPSENLRRQRGQAGRGGRANRPGRGGRLVHQAPEPRAARGHPGIGEDLKGHHSRVGIG